MLEKVETLIEELIESEKNTPSVRTLGDETLKEHANLEMSGVSQPKALVSAPLW